MRGQQAVTAGSRKSAFVVGQNPAVGFLVVNDVGVVQAAAANGLAEQVHGWGGAEEEAATFVVDGHAHVYHDDEVVGTGGHFRVGRHAAAAAAALGVVNAGKAGAGGGGAQPGAAQRCLHGLVGRQLHGGRLPGFPLGGTNDALYFVQVDLAAQPAVVLAVGVGCVYVYLGKVHRPGCDRIIDNQGLGRAGLQRFGLGDGPGRGQGLQQSRLALGDFREKDGRLLQ